MTIQMIMKNCCKCKVGRTNNGFWRGSPTPKRLYFVVFGQSWRFGGFSPYTYHVYKNTPKNKGCVAYRTMCELPPNRQLDAFCAYIPLFLSWHIVANAPATPPKAKGDVKNQTKTIPIRTDRKHTQFYP